MSVTSIGLCLFGKLGYCVHLGSLCRQKLWSTKITTMEELEPCVSIVLRPEENDVAVIYEARYSLIGHVRRCNVAYARLHVGNLGGGGGGWKFTC